MKREKPTRLYRWAQTYSSGGRDQFGEKIERGAWKLKVGAVDGKPGIVARAEPENPVDRTVARLVGIAKSLPRTEFWIVPENPDVRVAATELTFERFMKFTLSRIIF